MQLHKHAVQLSKCTYLCSKVGQIFYVVCLKNLKKTYIKLTVSYFLKHDEEDLLTKC